MRVEELRSGLAARLRGRRPEIEQAVFTRISSVADPSERPDPEYTDGLRDAVAAALEHGIEAIECSEDRPPPLPTVLLSQARLAARHGVELATVLRRYLAGYTLLGDFLIEESESAGPLNGAALKRLLRVQAALLDRLIAAVSEEYAREAKSRPRSGEQRRLQRIERLLAGQFVDVSDFAYELEGHHLGLVAAGPGAAAALEDLGLALDRRLLAVNREEGILWAWLGSRRGFGPEQLAALAAGPWPQGVALALGEPGEGVAGWRLTHRQARAALPIALRRGEGAVRYAEVALLASMLRDDLLATSLRELYLAPLEAERDGGKAALQTLRAYFGAGRNLSSAAAVLGINRNTVANRLRAIEVTLGRPLEACGAELEAALHLSE